MSQCPVFGFNSSKVIIALSKTALEHIPFASPFPTFPAVVWGNYRQILVLSSLTPFIWELVIHSEGETTSDGVEEKFDHKCFEMLLLMPAQRVSLTAHFFVSCRNATFLIFFMRGDSMGDIFIRGDSMGCW